eukprot:3176313-Pyramimonas_sp.AAC.1
MPKRPPRGSAREIGARQERAARRRRSRAALALDAAAPAPWAGKRHACGSRMWRGEAVCHEMRLQD